MKASRPFFHGSLRIAIWSIPFLLTLALIIRLAITATEQETDKVWERIQTTGVLRVGMDMSYPPFAAANEEGQPYGFDVEIAKELAGRWGVKLELIHLGFDGLYDALQGERIDVIISALPYDPRRADVLYSYAYFENGPVLVVPVGGESIRRVEDLVGKRVGVELGSQGDVEARRLEERLGLDRRSYLTAQETLDALAKGEVDAALVDAVSAYHWMGSNHGFRIAVNLLREQYVIAVSEETSKLLQEINSAIVEWREDGFLVGLIEDWLMRPD